MDFTIDCHFHIWDLDKFPEAAAPLEMRKNILPKDYEQNRGQTPIKYSVFVQTINASPAEAKWACEYAEEYPFIKGVVAGLDLTDPALEETLKDLRQYQTFVGVRHILDFEKEDYITREDVHQGLAVLDKCGLTFDLLLRPHLLKYIPALAKEFPNLRMVVNHIAKPLIKDRVMDGWKEEMAEIAKYPNIYCKISGMVTEADLNDWTQEDLVPYVKHVIDIFGPDRCMFGSDWPMCILANASLEQVYKLAVDLVSYLPKEQQQKVFKDNAVKFYKLCI